MEAVPIWSVKNNGFVFNLNMVNGSLEQCVVRQILESLTDESGVTAENDGQYFVPYETICDLSEEEQRALGLPEVFPFSLQITASGNLADRDFRYKLAFLKDGNTPFINPKRQGMLLEITPEQTYILCGDHYRIVKAIDDFNSQPRSSSVPSQLQKNLLTFADIKGLSRKSAVVLDSYLNAEEVIKPSQIAVRIKRGLDGSIEIEPKLVCDDVEVAPSINTSFVKVFDNFNIVRSMYPIPSGPRVVIGDKQKKLWSKSKLTAD